jgi:hypothetical protein
MINDTFEKFMNVMEMLYAVFMTWGFAKIAEKYAWNIEYWLPSLIAVFVLIRFFFAPAHNLKEIARELHKKPFWQIYLFVIDIPFLLAHSFIFYRMCDLVTNKDYYNFYILFSALLFINVLWLLTISARKYLWGIRPCSKHLIWAINNIVCFFVLISLFKFTQIRILWHPLYLGLFGIALLNCVIDFVFTAPYYLGFKNE